MAKVAKPAKSKSVHYVLVVDGDIEPRNPIRCRDEAHQCQVARKIKKEIGDSGGIYWMRLTPSGRIYVGSYSGSFFNPD